MPPRALSAVIALTLAVLPARPDARQPSLPDVMRRTAAYVQQFHAQLSAIVSEETYSQWVYSTARRNDPMAGTIDRITLRSDLMLIRPAHGGRYVEFRDVFEVDGEAVHDRQRRIESLWQIGSKEATAELGAILAESARYNIGSIQRNINTPLMALMFLEQEYQPRFTFKRSSAPRPVLGPQHGADTSGVFRATTEMWNIEFEEKRGNTIIRQPNGRNQRSRGRYWVNPDTGAVLISELVVDGGGVIAEVTVSYQSEPLMGFLVPVEMRESYERRGETITGHARYGKFRLIKE